MIFKFRMLSDESDHFVRDLEVPYDMNLKAFFDFLIRSLGYEDIFSSIFTADGRWERQREFVAADPDPKHPEDLPAPMDRVTLGQLLHRLHDRLIFVFDPFNDRALYLELTEARTPDPAMAYPRVAFEHGSAPDQFDPEATCNERSIFEEMMGDYNEFEGDDRYDDE